MSPGGAVGAFSSPISIIKLKQHMRFTLLSSTIIKPFVYYTWKKILIGVPSTKLVQTSWLSYWQPELQHVSNSAWLAHNRLPSSSQCFLAASHVTLNAVLCPDRHWPSFVFREQEPLPSFSQHTISPASVLPSNNPGWRSPSFHPLHFLSHPLPPCTASEHPSKA